MPKFCMHGTIYQLLILSNFRYKETTNIDCVVRMQELGKQFCVEAEYQQHLLKFLTGSLLFLFCLLINHVFCEFTGIL